MKYRLRPFLLTILFAVCALPFLVTADCPDGATCLENPIKSPTLSAFLTDAADVALTLAGPVIIIAIIAVGFLFVKARGEPKELETAKHAFLYTVIGAAVILGATLLASVIQQTIDNVRTG
jgi:hypothetical protein